ncbi:MAG: SsrA-binding protein [Bacteroidetes bacterium]|nr:SsrA-binding protein [Bacteroidota bacterium]MDA0860026.1 SsrA-binding protein [Bacteroidota bacterium]MDA1318123.1 SsrA-binding protein [Bacteroidota bacterium]
MKLVFKTLALINKLLLPSLTKRRVDLTKATKFQMALLGWRTFITMRALD